MQVTFTREELLEVSDSLMGYVMRMVKIGQTGTEVKYRSLANTWSAQKKVMATMFASDMPDWIESTEEQVMQAIKAPKLITDEEAKGLRP